MIDIAHSAPASSDRHLFQFVDLFAGIGGFRLGLEAAGGSCVYSVEWDKFARQTYAANFGDEPKGGDIREVRSLPPHDVLAAGFPCQPFSLAGVSKKASLGRAHGFADQTQGTLFFELQRLIDQSKPPILLLENVKNLLSHDGGRTFDVIRAVLDDLDYAVSVSIVDAQHWVPQHRERTIIIGLHRSKFGSQVLEPPRRPIDSIQAPKLRSVLQNRYDQRYVLTDGLWQYLREYKAKHRRLGNGFGYGLASRDGIARTLSARYHKDGSEILIPRRRGQNPRRLTPRECARLMGFPDSYVIPVSDTQAYRQFGNAVVVPVIADVARTMVLSGVIGVATGRASGDLSLSREDPKQLDMNKLLLPA